MDAQILAGKFENLSQRVASTYCRMLTQFCPVLPEGITLEQQAEMAGAQADLHAFFKALYASLFESPAQFGLPVTEDFFVIKDHVKEGPDKTEVKKVLDRPRKLVENGLAFLSSAALSGHLEDGKLVLDPAEPALAFLKKKPGKTWLAGMTEIGLTMSQIGSETILTNPRFPRMMPALQLLAQACAGCPDALQGGVFFARCDFKALQHDFSVDPLGLYRIFPPEDYQWAVEMHDYFTGHGYQAQIEINHMFQWVIKYQGKRAIKSTPLFQIWFDERMLHQMAAGIKCASSARVIPLLPQFSQALQDDFAQRAFNCGNCHWCDSRPSLGPTEFEYRGEKRSICWYVPSDLKEYTPQSIALVKEYAQLHEALA